MDTPDSIGHYRIGEKLGQGGMGEVYRATDTRLGRDVAIKRITPELAKDAVRMASLTREAQVLASLNHPNIASIYGIEDEAIVMELVEGPTLAERLEQGPLPLEEALAIGRQIAEALATAHDKGIVHRDLKPANIKVTSDGTVKLLDFGLAKAAAAANLTSEEAATIAMSLASSGLIVGTPGYMAPEQARGLPVDKRVDIWAFGVVLYEMLTGTTLFRGDTITDVMAAVVREQPDLSRVAPSVRPLLRRCLEKNPRKRLRDIGDATLLLETAAEAPATVPPTTVPRGLHGTPWLPWAVAAVLAAVLLGLVAMRLRETPPQRNVVRLKVTLPAGVTQAQTGPFAIAPDGRTVAFPAVGQDGTSHIWLHPLDALEPRPLMTAEIGTSPGVFQWSPDSGSILYSHDQRLKRVDVAGGPPVTLAQVEGPVIGAAWHANGTVIYGTRQGIMRIAASGGTPTPVTRTSRNPETLHSVQGLFPDGRHFMYLLSGRPGERAVYVGDIEAAPDAPPGEPLLRTDFDVAFVPGRTATDEGHLLWLRDGTLLAQPFDAGTRALTGEARPVAQNVFSINEFSPFGFAYFSSSQQGTLVYRTGTLAERLSRRLTWFSRDGKRLGTVGDLGRYNQLKVSPDGTRIVTSQTELETGANADIWIVDVATETSTRFTFGGGANVQPVWSPDGRDIAWIRTLKGTAGLYRKRADGSGSEELLATMSEKPGYLFNVSDWSPDGRLIFFSHGPDVFAVAVNETPENRKPFQVADTPGREFGAIVSPDNRWLAYVSTETGQQELYVQPFTLGGGVAAAPTAGGKWLVSRRTLGLARWRRDSRELIFLGVDGALSAVDITTTPAFRASAPRELFQLPQQFLLQARNPGALADAARDHERFLFAMPSEEGARQELTVVLNWQEDLR